MRIPNDMFDEDHNVRPELSKNDTESDEDEFDEGGASLLDRYPWLMKAGIVVGVLTVVGVLALGTRAVLGHHNSDEPNTAQTSERRHSKSTRHANNSAISSSHADNSAKKSSAIKQVSESSNQSAKSTSDSSATNTSAGSTSTSGSSTNVSATSKQDTDAQAVQKRIQSSLPNVKVGITTLSTKGDVDVSSVNDNGQVVTTLSSSGHKFATIVTKDGSDTLSLLPGYQSYTDEHVSIK